MKRLIKYLFIMLAGVIVFTSCEDERERDFESASLTALTNEGTVMFSSTASTLQFTIPAPGEVYENKDFTVYARVVGPPPAENVTVNFEIDAASTAVEGTHYTLSASSFTIEAGMATAFITVTILEENCELDTPYNLIMNLTGTSSASYVLNETALGFNGRIFKPCFVDILAFDKVYEVTGDEPYNCIVSVYDVDDMLIKLDGIWLATDEFILQVNLDETLVDPFIGSAEDYEGQFIGLLDETYGRVRFEDVNGGKILNTCNGSFEFKATPTLPDSGFWWGGEFTFTLVPSGKGSYQLVVSSGSLEKPVKR